MIVALLSAGGLVASGCATPSSSAGTPPAATAVMAGVAKDPALYASLPASLKSTGVVRVATDVPYAPFELYGADHKSITGLDVDLGHAIGAKLGVEFQFAEQNFDGIIPAIQAGKFDVVMSAMTDTKERQGILSFVDYSASGSGILVKKGNPDNIKSVLDLCGQPVAVQSGSKQAKLLSAAKNPCTEAGKPSPDLSQLPKDSDGQLAIISGRVVADFMDQPAAGYSAKTADGGTAFEVVIDSKYPNGVDASPNGIGVDKSQTALVSAIQKALQELINDGTYGKILANYGQAGIALKKATVNAATS